MAIGRPTSASRSSPISGPSRRPRWKSPTSDSTTPIPNGLFFARLASSIGLEGRNGAVRGQRVWLPDGTERFVVDESMLLDWTARLRDEPVDPLKTTNVQQQRCMTTWCLRKIA